MHGLFPIIDISPINFAIIDRYGTEISITSTNQLAPQRTNKQYQNQAKKLEKHIRKKRAFAKLAKKTNPNTSP